ncbi:prostatic steroid-binding protein C1-like [Acomys russatus]|uniref:prostatic steroid-binding protein C1-like n=1 Tax=Acomys russatus TaxID=60746 RepID=UPI0021E2FB99|nr:prostatic steroid-binding protein C1-like [Acomys russatus]
MRLSLCLLLIILAVCCYEANAGAVCKAVVRESVTFVLLSEGKLKAELERYDAPEEAVDAKLEVKRCVDQMWKTDRAIIGSVLTKILLECGLKGYVESMVPPGMSFPPIMK